MDEAAAYPNGAADFEAHGIGTPMSAGAYGLSKALLNSYTILAAREHPSLKINSCSPGMIATGPSRLRVLPYAECTKSSFGQATRRPGLTRT